jgi:phosphonate transport system permease protein
MGWRWPTPKGTLPWPVVAGLVAVIALLVLAAPIAEVDPVRLFNSIGRMIEFTGHLFVEPKWSYIPELLGKMRETIEMTVLATFIATLLSFPLALLAAKNASPHPLVFHATRNLLSLMRALPELVWALVFVSAVGLGPLPGIMALALVTVGFMAKFFAESIEVVGTQAVEGVAAHGAGWLQMRWFGMLPQALPDFAGSLMYILDHNLRAAAILGLVGAGGIGYDMVMAMRMFEYDRLLLIAFAIYLCVTLLDRASDSLRSRLIHG